MTCTQFGLLALPWLLLLLLLRFAPAAAAEPLKPAGLTDVTFTDRFWAPRLETNRTVTVPHNLEQCEVTHRIANFEVAAGLKEGGFEGIYFNDSDVYKAIEAASYSLALHPDPDLDAYLDGLIAKIAAAQQPDGYLNTYFTLVEPGARWTDLPVKHELYCAGHLFEAAVAHSQATGKRNLLNVAIRFADYIDSIFGEGKRIGVPGHEEIELALIKLYELTGERRYLELARFFIDQRGYSDREYCQDHLPVREQTEIVGHAVRAMYLYAGVADLYRYTGDPALLAAMDRIWTDVTQRKLYITGGVGPSAHNEGFTTSYDLPNETAYAETCAGIGLILWSHRMVQLHARAEYADVLEQVLYNGFLSGVSLSGDRFFYVNPLASKGGHHRQPWFGCACCPPNVARLLPQIGRFAYSTSADGVWVHLYAGSRASLQFAAARVELVQETDYPWSGSVKLTVNPTAPATFTVNLRIPGWCGQAAARVNGEAIDATPGANGYLAIRREWQAGDAIALELPMPVQRMRAHPKVAADVGRVALQRGPLIYCLEAVDNGGSVLDLALPPGTPMEPVWEADLLGGIVVLRGQALRSKPLNWADRLYQPIPAGEPAELVAIPYYAWDNREAGEMVVWIPESTGMQGDG